MSKQIEIPKYDDLFKPTLEALANLGGSASIDELEDALIGDLAISQDQLDIAYPSSGAAIVPDRMSWARSFLKIGGFITNPKRGVWVLTEEGRDALTKSNGDLKKAVSAADKIAVAAKKASRAVVDDESGNATEGNAPSWADQLLQKVQSIDPSAFERLCQRLLRESGFTRVEVSGKSGDGGIDGVGVLRVNLISFQVLFQCKRWKGSVGSEVVRNFRGAMQGRADKGLVITTGTFTAEARREATRDGAPAIDLIDGEALCGLMKDLGLGLNVKEIRVEEVSLDEDFFASI
ncbi:MAG: restriction endonuclease [Alphaproteobacteria bacterium]